ncbi:MAG: hypothetical protein K2P92_00715, partial [Bdellovibrionaceae bacterium]|nr:hypothetical protein [Pseudobdellovibrionaceae bacterium]
MSLETDSITSMIKKANHDAIELRDSVVTLFSDIFKKAASDGEHRFSVDVTAERGPGHLITLDTTTSFRKDRMTIRITPFGKVSIESTNPDARPISFEYSLITNSSPYQEHAKSAACARIFWGV